VIELPDLPVTAIRRYERVPSIAGRALIRLPRCAVCFDEIHDYRDGVAYCAPIDGEYRPMDDAQLRRWNEADQDDKATIKLESD
jgi:hypothetical protein